MSSFAGKRTGTQDLAHHAPDALAAVGKQSLVAQVQQLAAGAASASVHDAAAAGVATPASALPHADTIQRAFGRHDISGVQAHTGADASASAQAMGAQAYATGNHVVLGGAADLHTVAHEAAHVVQQRGGVQLKGGVGQAGDPYERHADAVADAVVQGRSAESLLDPMAGGGGGGGGAVHAVQHKLLYPGNQPVPHGDLTAFYLKNEQLAPQIKRLSAIATPLQITTLEALAAEIESGEHAELLAQRPDGISHPDWIDGEKLDRWPDKFQNHEKTETLHSLNRAKNQGAIPGQSVTYLGGDQDIEHPLYATNCTHLTLVGIDPDALKNSETAGQKRREVLEAASKGIVAKLNSYKKDGVKITVELESPVATIRVIDAQSDAVRLTIEYHAETYDEFIGGGPPKPDIVMDKDSWLKQWKNFNDHQAVQAIAELTNAGGLWLGGFTSDKALGNEALTSLFHDITDTVSPERQKWSGYEPLKVRKLREQPVVAEPTAEPADPVWEMIVDQVLPTVNDQLNRQTMDDLEYRGLLDSVEYIVPYIDGIADAHYTRLAQHIVDKIAGFSAGPAGITLEKVKQDLEALGE